MGAQLALGAGNQKPYYHHSSSNGPIWAQYLSGILEMPLLDYAVSGAVSGGTTAKTPFVIDECGGIPVVDKAVAGVLNNRPAVPSMLQQVTTFVKEVGPDGASPKAVYFIVRALVSPLLPWCRIADTDIDVRMRAEYTPGGLLASL